MCLSISDSAGLVLRSTDGIAVGCWPSRTTSASPQLAQWMPSEGGICVSVELGSSLCSFMLCRPQRAGYEVCILQPLETDVEVSEPNCDATKESRCAVTVLVRMSHSQASHNC